MFLFAVFGICMITSYDFYTGGPELHTSSFVLMGIGALTLLLGTACLRGLEKDAYNQGYMDCEMDSEKFGRLLRGKD